MPPKLNTGDFYLPYNPALIDQAKELRQNPTAAERKLWQNFLKSFPYRVLRQRPIHHFIVDFYCPRLKLVIEIDGDVHFTDAAKAYDAERTQVLEGYGLQVIRFTNAQVMDDFEAVCQKTQGMIPSRSPSERGNRASDLESLNLTKFP